MLSSWKHFVTRNKYHLVKYISHTTVLFLVAWWIVRYRTVYLAEGFALPADNYAYHYPFFLYVVKYIRYFESLPDWLFAKQGGVWFEPLANNFLFFLPHRIVGYVMGAFTHLHPNLIYKSCFFFVGQGIFMFGIYLLAKRLFASNGYALVATTISFFTSVTIGMVHQEHALGTVFYLPFLWLSLLSFQKSQWHILVLCTLLGLTLNNHYPQLIIGYLIIILTSGVAFLPEWRKRIVDLVKQPALKLITLLLISSLFFVTSASPLLYSYFSYANRLSSSFRGQSDTIVSNNYDDYLSVASRQNSSVAPKTLRTYFGFNFYKTEKIGTLDLTVFFITPAILLALFVLIFLPFPHKIFHISVLCLLCLFSIGIYGPAPKILWHILPGIKMFRQWYHFVPILNLHLIYVVIYSIKLLVEMKSPKMQDKIFIAAGTITLVVLTIYELIPVNHVAIAAFFLALCLLPFGIANRRIILSMGFFSWLGYTSMVWSQHILDKVIVPQLARVDRSEYHEPDLLTDLATTYHHRMFVAPRKSCTEADHSIKLNGLFYGEDKKGNHFPINKNLYSSYSKGNKLHVSFSVPPTTRALLFLQHNDDRWEIQDKRSQTIPVEMGPSCTVKIPYELPNKELTISRKKTWWSILIWIMWLPLAVIGLFVLVHNCIKKKAFYI